MPKTKLILLLLAALLTGVCLGFFGNSAIIRARIRHFSQIPENMPRHITARLTERLHLDPQQQEQEEEDEGQQQQHQEEQQQEEQQQQQQQQEEDAGAAEAGNLETGGGGALRSSVVGWF